MTAYGQSALDPPPGRHRRSGRSSGSLIVALLLIALIILHQDNWFWVDRTLVFGFLPIGLFWHICISVAAAITWWIATWIAWPIDSNSDRED